MGRAQGQTQAVAAPRRSGQQSPTWPDARIERELRALIAERPGRFPTITQFRGAGVEGLYVYLRTHELFDEWAQRLGVERVAWTPGMAKVWDEETIRAALEIVCDGKAFFPSVNEMRAAGLYGLYQVLHKKGLLDEWARRMGLPRQEVSKRKEREPVSESQARTDLSARVAELTGTDLLRLHRRQAATTGEQRSKSWAQDTLRRLLGKAASGMNIRTVPARVAADGRWTITSTMPLGPVDFHLVADLPFDQSEAYLAMSDIALVVREDEQRRLAPGEYATSRVLRAARFRISEHPEFVAELTADYEQARAAILAGEELHGGIGALMQTRTKGLGGETQRTFAFYARPALVARMLELAREDAAKDANTHARESRALAARRPSVETLRARLERMLDGRESQEFPSIEEFKKVGKETLYWQLRATRNMTDWADEYGLSYRSTTAVWTGPRIESELADMLDGRAVFPTRGEFNAALGADGERLFKRVLMYGGTEFWARWMGVLPRNPNEQDIEQALGRFLKGRETWPSDTEFKLAGLGRLSAVIRERDETSRWQEHFGVCGRVWADERIDDSIRRAAESLGRTPTRKELRARYGAGLLDAIDRNPDSTYGDRCKRLGLAPSRAGRTAARDPLWGDDRIGESIRQAAGELGRTPSTAELEERFGAGLVAAIYRTSTYSDWCQRIGLTPRGRGRPRKADA